MSNLKAPKTRSEKEAKGNLEMAFLHRKVFTFLFIFTLSESQTKEEWY